MDRGRSPALPWTDGQIEALKWVGLAAMGLDHVGRFLLGAGERSWVFAGGRLAFPLFALALGLNLARPGDAAGRARRTGARLAAWAAVSVLPSILMRGHPQVLNVLATLGLGTALAWAFVAPVRLSTGLAVCATAVLAARWVEFGLAGVLLVPLVFLALHRREAGLWWAVGALLVALAWHNGRAGGLGAAACTLAVTPLALAVRALPLRVPATGRLFYVLYPLHLSLIGLARHWGA